MVSRLGRVAAPRRRPARARRAAHPQPGSGSETEPDNWLGLLGLVAAALVEPSGLADGQRCLYLLVRASALGHLDHDLVEDAIRAMKESRRSAGTVVRLGSAVRRSLATLARSDHDQIATTAAALVRSFFG